jgi:uncharacterized protein (TIGR03435 family)
MRWEQTALFLLGAAACTAGGRPEFAVTSVKPDSSPSRPEVGNFNGRGYAKHATLKMIIATAYQVPVFQISGGPAWVDSDRFEVEGKADDPTTGYVPLRLMMQSLLEDRFHLKVHRETRVAPVFSLVIAKGNLKLRLSADQTSPDASDPGSSPDGGPPRGSVLMSPGMIMANAASMAVVTRVLTPELERPVLDRTNLTGRFDIRLQWMPDGTANTSDLPTIFTALREQLGLELKSARGPVEFLVIDSAVKPSPN